MTQAIKGFSKDWTCLGFQFAPGQTYTHTGPVRACEGGFHAIEGHPLEVFSYYPPATSRYASVTLAGALAREEGADSKVAAEILTVGGEVSLADLIGKAVAYVVSHAKPSKGASVKAQGSAAQASGYQGAAQASGDQGAAQASGYRGAARYPFPDMEIGDSFILKLSADPKKAKAKRGVISCLMIYHSRKRGTKYASRRLPEGLRVWRVA